ncbi:thrombospondin type-1 domain-containing protein 7A-like isoform X2 [Uloborus diversus]|uniref:thrombospondin type-1 domain-containing protein 7A-like isoform X2 n=1 Tax=Uloborus diversus TaxID=327109 RepID=UPI002409387E|nr:thrombospondin type-1 domain-containing protein 7A-like isoform X2 [Uloborus diversus]
MTSGGVRPGLERDFCWSDCPVDCQMSTWSNWTACNVPCGQGFKERRRQIVVPANHLGRPCPQANNGTEIQKEVCNVLCTDYRWSTGGWSTCKLSEAESVCGNGTRYRTVKCLEKRSESTVDDSRCDPLERPASYSHCRIHCPGECVVSPWTVTKKCSEPCSANYFQESNRKILRFPNSTVDTCPELTSKKSCILNKTCHEHSWILGPWGSCILPTGAYCGEGVQKRPLVCLRSDGRQVDGIQCEKGHKSLSLKEPVSKPCYVDCPVDCELSEWSPWNQSDCNACGLHGVMTRRRQVIQPPSDAGQPCPAEMVQRKPCPFKACYRWKHSQWSDCELEGAHCGFGVRRRLVECIRYDGLRVDKIYCLSINVSFSYGNWLDPAWLIMAQEESQEEQLCHTPCPGDCIVTEWSEWNHCHKNCRAGQKVGYQTSSRKILFPASKLSLDACPSKMWRRKPCWKDDCNVFHWRLKNDTLICERKDGLLVQGGCTSEPRPCWGKCETMGGLCDPTSGLCHCEDSNGHRLSVLSPSSGRCPTETKGPHPPANHSAPTAEIRLMYYPDDSKASFWMYAMISIGTAFVIFVAVTVYLMCRSSLRQRTVSVERQPSLRRRNNISKMTSESTNADEHISHQSYSQQN